MNCPPQVTDSFAVNNANMENPSFLTLTEIMRHEIFHFFRIKAVEIENAIDWIFDRLIRIRECVVHAVTIAFPSVQRGVTNAG